MRKIALLIILLISLLGFALYLVIRTVHFPPSKFEEGELFVDGVRAQTAIHRNMDGVPVISASSENDFFFALGFVHARDFGWQLYVNMLAAKGELSSRFGDEYLTADRLSKLIGSAGASKGMISDTSLEKIEAYVNGVNYFIDEIGKNYPIQFTLSNTKPEPITTADVLKIYRMALWLMDSGWQETLLTGVTNASMPRELLPHLLMGADAFVLEDGLIEPALWLLKSDALLRKATSAPAGVPAMRGLRIANENQHAIYLAFQSGTTRPGFWMPVDVRLQGYRSNAMTIPGIPFLWSVLNEERVIVRQPGLPMPLPIFKTENTQTSDFLITRKNQSQERLGIHSSGYDAGIGIFPEVMFRGLNTAIGSGINGLLTFGQPEPTGSTPYLVAHRWVASGNRTFHPGLGVGQADHIADALQSGEPEWPYLDQGAQDMAQALIQAFRGEAPNPQLDALLSYFENWAYSYSDYSVAATLLEGILMNITRNTLQNYLPEPRFDRLSDSGFMPVVYARGLVHSYDAHLADPRVFSPIDGAFLYRRLQETVHLLEEMHGSNTYEWRWGQVNEYRITDHLLCGNPGGTLYVGGRICRQTLERGPAPVSGGPGSLVSASHGMGGITTHFWHIELQDNPSVSLSYGPGWSGNPAHRGYDTLMGNFGGNRVSGTAGVVPESVLRLTPIRP